MLQTTNADHSVSESGRFGPYLQLQSINPLTGGSTIRADSSGDWRFDPQTGRLVAFAPMCPEIVLLHETGWWPEHLELRLDQPAGDVMGLVTAQVFMDELAAMARPQWSSGNAMFAGLCLLVGALFFIRCSRWLRNGDALLRSVATLLTMAATAALLLGGALLMWDQHLDAYRMVVCSLGFVVLWAGGVLLHVQFAARQHDRFRNPTICTQCAYDLRGTLAAGRHECPECGKQAA
jgi:hypothetical protein